MSSESSPQIDLCDRFGAVPMPPSPDSRVGVSASVLAGEVPVHGMRIPPDGSLNGWFIWSGEQSDDPDFFQPLCADHIPSVIPIVLPYIALPPGWRFLVAPGHRDVWFDPALLLPRE